MQTQRRAICRFGVTLILISLLTGVPAGAREYPSDAIRIVVPSAAGTPPDIISRIIANELAQSERWRLVVENRPGAIQTLGAAEVLKQPADGHTIISVTLSASAAPALLPKVGFRLYTDFEPVVKLATAHHVLVVHPSLPVQLLSELVTLLKSQPDKHTFSSGGFGTPAHLAGELFKLETGVRTTHVPYQTLPRAIGDLLNATNQYQFITPLPVLDLISVGKLRALAVTAPTRMPALKDVPTVIEEKSPNLIIQDWFGYLVKKGTSPHIVARLNEAINKAHVRPEVRASIMKLGAQPAGGSSAEFGQFVTSQVVHWGRVVQDSGIKMHQ
jgi:tripartite-type tricarboxylate transporter receptor subunit TctC